MTIIINQILDYYAFFIVEIAKVMLHVVISLIILVWNATDAKRVFVLDVIILKMAITLMKQLVLKDFGNYGG